MGEQPGRAAPRGQRRRQAVDAVDARDLLDQVDLARDVVAAQRRHGHVEPVGGRLDGEVERSAGSRAWRSTRDGDAEDRPYARLAQSQRRGARRRRRRRRSFPARRARRRTRSAGAWRAPARACTARAAGPSRSARRPRCAGRARHEARWMFGPLQVATSSSTRVVLGSHLRARAAHQPGDRRRALGVLDHDHLLVERARLAVERLHLLALARAAHGQPLRRPRGRGRRRAAAGRSAASRSW